jgi:hypothetical protein
MPENGIEEASAELLASRPSCKDSQEMSVLYIPESSEFGALVSSNQITKAFPVLAPDSFSGHMEPGDQQPRRMYIPTIPGPAPRIVKTETTRCLIRALRSRIDSSSLTSAAVCSSMNPSVQRLQQQLLEQHQVRAQAQNPTCTAATPPAPPTRVVAVATKSGRESRCSDVSARPSKSTRGGVSWSFMTRERRQACLRIGLAAAVSKSPVPSISELHRVWQLDPRCPQRVTPEIRRELAESAFSWTVAELKDYLCEAGLSPVGPKIELARRVHLHIRPPSELLYNAITSSTPGVEQPSSRQ